MKKNKYTHSIKAFLFCLLFVTMAGCNDFLEIAPPSSISPENYLLSEDQLAAYTIRYYAEYGSWNQNSATAGGMIPSHLGGGSESFYRDDDGTDNAVTRSSNDRFKPGLWRTSTTGGYWNFSNIYALNYYLQTVVPRLEAGELKGNPSMILHYVGEGYFLRAHEYFFRLRKLGDFPIVTNTLPDNKEELIAASVRQPRNEVARFILSDLDEAIKLMNNSVTKQRITKNVALLLKARVALFEASWLTYHKGTSMVPKGEGWPGDPSYQFPSGSIEKEIEFFLTEAMDASDQVASVIPLVENNKVIRESTAQPINPYYDMFATENPSKYPEVLMYRGYVDGLVTHSYNHRNYHGAQSGFTHQMEQNQLMANGLPIYAAGSGYAGDDFIEDTKIDRDWRWRLFMKAPNEVKAFINTNTVEKFANAPLVYSTDVKWSTSTGYILGKAFSHDYSNQVLEKDKTAAVIFRAVEAYLIYMEASYMKNGTIDSKADAYWRAIRTRAGVDPDYNKTIAATDMSIEALNDWGAYSKGELVDATLYNIRRERRSELMNEGLRYSDLIRWRAMDQLDGFQIEGCKVWGPMYERFDEGVLLADQADPTKNTMSSPNLSLYMRPFQVVVANNNFYDGLYFTEAHYLDPIALEHFLDTAEDGQTPSTSPIYQNPGWPAESGAAPLGF